MTGLEALVLCFFDNLKGPTITHVLDLDSSSASTELPPNVHAEIVKLIDLQNTEEFFTYGFETYSTANLYIQIPSEWARGKQEILCLSILTHSGKPEFFKETLIGGAQRLKAIPNIFKAFHIERKAQDQEIDDKRQELKEFLSSFCQDVLRAREKAITKESGQKRKRNRIRDQKRDLKRDDTRDQNRDDTRDQNRDDTRDQNRDDTRDQNRDDTRDQNRDDTRDQNRDETRDQNRDDTRDQNRDETRDRKRDYARDRDRDETRDRDQDKIPT